MPRSSGGGRGWDVDRFWYGEKGPPRTNERDFVLKERKFMPKEWEWLKKEQEWIRKEQEWLKRAKELRSGLEGVAESTPGNIVYHALATAMCLCIGVDDYTLKVLGTLMWATQKSLEDASMELVKIFTGLYAKESSDILKFLLRYATDNESLLQDIQAFINRVPGPTPPLSRPVVEDSSELPLSQSPNGDTDIPDPPIMF